MSRISDLLNAHHMPRPLVDGKWTADLGSLHEASSAGLMRRREDREQYVADHVAKPPRPVLVSVNGEPLRSEEPKQ